MKSHEATDAIHVSHLWVNETVGGHHCETSKCRVTLFLQQKETEWRNG